MSVYLPDTARRGESGLGEFAVAEHEDLQLPEAIVADLTERNFLPEWRRTSNMKCHVIAEGKDYRLGADVTIAGQVWTEVEYADPNALVESDVFDGDGFVKPEILRNLFINDAFVVASEVAMLALTTVTGNVIVRSDIGAVFLKLNNDDPSDIGDFANITGTVGAVSSVNGQTGAVSITIANLLAVSQNLIDFNAAVETNSLILNHSASIASLTSSKADLVAGKVPLSQLPYVFQSGLSTNTNEVRLGGAMLYDTEFGLATFNMVIQANGGGGFGVNFGSDAAYDLIFRGPSGYLTRLGKGTDGQVLRTQGGVLAWVNEVGWGTISGVITDQTDLTTYLSTNYYSKSGTDARYVQLSGSTMTGYLTLHADPTNALHAATKSYVDNLLTGLSWKTSVAAATTANITLSGEQTIDGVLTSSSRVLVKNQSTATQNGIYVSAAGAWSRATDTDTGTELVSATVLIAGGSVNGNTQWTCSNTSVTIGVTNVTFVQIASAGVYTNGTGITLTGNAFSINQAANLTWTGTHSFRDASFSLLDNSDTSKVAKFELSGITTATTRTFTVPDFNGTVLVSGGANVAENLIIALDDVLDDYLFRIYSSSSGAGFYILDLSGEKFLGLSAGGTGGTALMEVQPGLFVMQAVTSGEYKQFEIGAAFALFTDNTSSKTGITYAASGYENSNLSLTSRGYVLGAKTFTGSQTFRAGTASAGTAPIYLQSGTALTSPANGALEYHSSHLYFTIGSTRYQIDQQGGILGSTGSTDNALIRADGPGGSTIQTSPASIGDNAFLILGNASLSGSGREITVESSLGAAYLSIYGKNNGGVFIANGSGSETTTINGPLASFGNITVGSSGSAGGHTISTIGNTVGTFSIVGQPGIASAGGDVEILGGAGVGTNKDGGDSLINGGLPSGSGVRGNVGINTTFGPATGSRVTAFGNAAVVPSGAHTDGIILYGKDSSAGSANSTLALYLEQAVEAIGSFTPTQKLRIWINEVEYWIQLDPV